MMRVKQMVLVLSMFGAWACAAQAQMRTEAKIYVCHNENGQLLLQNLNMRAKCSERVVRVVEPMPRSRVSPQMSDPQPANGAIIAGAQVSPEVQQHRDASRRQILEGELAQAQSILNRLQTETRHTYSTSLDKDLKKNLAMAQANVKALQREIAQIKGMTDNDLRLVTN
ncbi:hypothetical protein [Hydromonas duriensis]|uniref:DUF4124 domain-containing protein n=1 Tax=Hydromonas duriensis TaxID=1527608 RepID=A0A4R6YBP4_9BURK|nr:hypothetical protein [Hydromonas duriensis]TDR33075.1 hypothetical protein DFR44_101125 [Hydromonas duriensis]